LKEKNFPVFLLVLVVMAFICGAMATFSVGRMRETPLSPEAADSIAREEARARIARDNESAANNERVKIAVLAVVTIAASLIVLPISFRLFAVGASHWHVRHAMRPDSFGNYPLIRDGQPMWNPNTGMMIGTAVSEATTIALAGQRAMVHATQAAFQHGIDRNQAGARQRRIGEQPDAPEGWSVTTPQAAPEPTPSGFLMVDDTGERPLVEPGKSVEVKQEANAWQ
jgi:hypothetical protein